MLFFRFCMHIDHAFSLKLTTKTPPISQQIPLNISLKILILSIWNSTFLIIWQYFDIFNIKLNSKLDCIVQWFFCHYAMFYSGHWYSIICATVYIFKSNQLIALVVCVINIIFKHCEKMEKHAKWFWLIGYLKSISLEKLQDDFYD